MSTPAEMAERHAAVLARLTELGLALAERVQARALEAEDARESADLAVSFHRVSRGVRQSIALEARLARETARAEREAQAGPAPAPRPMSPLELSRVKKRVTAVRDAVEDVIWRESEEEEVEFLCETLHEHLAFESQSPTFGQQDLDSHIAEVCAALDLPPPKPEAPNLNGAPPPGPGRAHGVPPAPPD